MTRKDYHHGNLKEEFLKIAFDFIHNDDIENLTLKILADKTGTSRSAIYRHFSSKDDLIKTIIEVGFDEFDKDISPILLNKNENLVDRFYLATKGYIHWAKNNPNLYRLLFGKKYAPLRESLLSIKDDSCSSFVSLKQTVQEGQESGIIKKDDSYKQAIIIWASLHGLSSLIIDDFLDVQEIYEELYNDMFKSLLSGLISNKVKLISSIPFVNNILKPKEL